MVLTECTASLLFSFLINSTYSRYAPTTSAAKVHWNEQAYMHAHTFVQRKELKLKLCHRIFHNTSMTKWTEYVKKSFDIKAKTYLLIDKLVVDEIGREWIIMPSKCVRKKTVLLIFCMCLFFSDLWMQGAVCQQSSCRCHRARDPVWSFCQLQDQATAIRWSALWNSAGTRTTARDHSF